MTVLCYHTVDPDWDSGLSMAPVTFADHCAWLAQNRHVVDLDKAIALMDRRGRLPRGVVCLTFDDGLAGLYDHALPVLRRLGLPASVFVVARTLLGDRTVDWIDDPPQHDLETLTLDQLQEMQEAGITIASHSMAHRVLTHMDPGPCREDLQTSRTVLEDLLETPVAHLAYPRGRHDDHVRQAASRAGYAYALALPEDREPTGPFSIPRVGIYRHNGMASVRVKTSPRYLSARTGSLHTAFTSTRQVLSPSRGVRSSA